MCQFSQDKRQHIDACYTFDTYAREFPKLTYKEIPKVQINSLLLKVLEMDNDTAKSRGDTTLTHNLEM